MAGFGELVGDREIRRAWIMKEVHIMLISSYCEGSGESLNNTKEENYVIWSAVHYKDFWKVYGGRIDSTLPWPFNFQFSTTNHQQSSQRKLACFWHGQLGWEGPHIIGNVKRHNVKKKISRKQWSTKQWSTKWLIARK